MICSEMRDGSDAEVINASNAESDAEVINASNALDLVDEALAALDQDDLERAEELAERLRSLEPPPASRD